MFKTCSKHVTNILALLVNHQEMHNLYAKYNVKTLTELHKSFINHDKITLLLQKERLFNYPEGTGVASVIHLYKTKHENNLRDRVRFNANRV